MSNQLDAQLFHEKQSLGYCAIHSLNNLFQEKWLTYDKFYSISTSLHRADIESGNAGWYSWNPYSIPIVGYFDIACIIKALEMRHFKVSSHIMNADGVSAICESAEELYAVKGILVNEECSTFGIFSTRHWYAIVYHQESGAFYNLDSKLDRPRRLPGTEELKQLLTESVKNSRSHIFVISADENSSS